MKFQVTLFGSLHKKANKSCSLEKKISILKKKVLVWKKLLKNILKNIKCAALLFGTIEYTGQVSALNLWIGELENLFFDVTNRSYKLCNLFVFTGRYAEHLLFGKICSNRSGFPIWFGIWFFVPNFCQNDVLMFELIVLSNSFRGFLYLIWRK